MFELFNILSGVCSAAVPRVVKAASTECESVKPLLEQVPLGIVELIVQL